MINCGGKQVVPDAIVDRGARLPEPSVAGQGLSAAIRCLIAGFVDAYALLNFRLFASFMSGNTTTAGVAGGEVKFALAARNLLPIPCFVLGVVIGTSVVNEQRRRALPRICWLVAAMLLMDLVAGAFSCPWWLHIMILSSAMGILNSSITQVGGQRVSLGFITGDLNSLGQQLALSMRGEPVSQPVSRWDTYCLRILTLASLWCFFLGGAGLGSLIASRLAQWTLLPPVLTLSILGLAESARYLRGHAGAAPTSS